MYRTQTSGETISRTKKGWQTISHGLHCRPKHYDKKCTLLDWFSQSTYGNAIGMDYPRPKIQHCCSIPQNYSDKTWILHSSLRNDNRQSHLDERRRITKSLHEPPRTRHHRKTWILALVAQTLETQKALRIKPRKSLTSDHWPPTFNFRPSTLDYWLYYE